MQIYVGRLRWFRCGHLRMRGSGQMEADCTKWSSCPVGAKYYLGQECNSQGKVCASYLTQRSLERCWEFIKLFSFFIGGNGVTCFWCFGSTIVRHLSKLLSVDRSTTMHAWPSRHHNAWRLFFLYNLRNLEAAVTCFQGYGSQKRSCLHWVNCKNTCYCAQWSKLLEEGSEVAEKAWDGLHQIDHPYLRYGVA